MEKPRSPGDPSLQGEVHGDAEHPFQVLFEVHDIPPEGSVEIDQDVQITLRTLLASSVGTEDADLADMIPLLEVGFCLPQSIND
jgi:hypothetical protein